MNKLTKKELEKELEFYGIPKSYLSKFIKKHGNIDGTIDTGKAAKIIEKISKIRKANQRIEEEYEPKSIFEDALFTPKELIDFIEWKLCFLKEKYAPYGLKLPFESLEEAHHWLKEESSSGVLTTIRLPDPFLEIKDNEVFKSSRITMPYRIIVNDKGINITDTIICNSSPFLIELNDTIKNLSATTGVNEIDILNFFLTGKDIEFPRIKITKTDTFNQYFILQINTNDITKDEWDKIFDIYRNNSNRKHRKKPSYYIRKLEEILESVEVPENPNADFYRDLIRIWNEKTGDSMSINSWRTMRLRHERLIKYNQEQIESMFQESLLRIIKEFKEEV